MSNHSLPIIGNLANPALFDNRGFIAGEWKNATLERVFPVIEPSSGQVLAHCADFSQQDFVDAINHADCGYRQYFSQTTAKERASYLQEWSRLILENTEDSTSMS